MAVSFIDSRCESEISSREIKKLYEGCPRIIRKNAATFKLFKDDQKCSGQLIIRILGKHCQNLGNIDILDTNIWLLRHRCVREGGELFPYFVDNKQL